MTMIRVGGVSIILAHLMIDVTATDLRRMIWGFRFLKGVHVICGMFCYGAHSYSPPGLIGVDDAQCGSCFLPSCVLHNTRRYDNEYFYLMIDLATPGISSYQLPHAHLQALMKPTAEPSHPEYEICR